MRLRLATKWKTDAHYNKYERRYDNGRLASRYIKSQAARERRRNSKVITRYELKMEV